MFNRASQSSLEYLVTYSWAIVIIAAVIGILFFTGFLSPRSSITSPAIAGFTQTPVGTAAANSSAMEFTVSDSVGSSIKILSVSAQANSANYTNFKCNSLTLYSGQTTTCFVYGTFSSPLTAQVSIKYNINTNGVQQNQSSSGTISINSLSSGPLPYQTAKTNFVAEGIPAGVSWNMSYGGNTVKTTGNYINFSGVANTTSSFTVYNQVVVDSSGCKTTYTPSPSTGLFTFGNSYVVSFSNSSVCDTVFVANVNSNTVGVVNISTDSVVCNITENIGPHGPDGISAFSRGELMYVANELSNSTSVISMANCAPGPAYKVIALGKGTEPFVVGVSPNLKYVFTSDFASDAISVIDPVTNTVKKNISFSSPSAYQLTVSPDSKSMYFVQGSELHVVNTNNLSNFKNISFKDPNGFFSSLTGVGATLDGKYIYVTSYTGGQVTVVNATTYSQIKNITGMYEPYYIAMDPAGKFVYVSNHKNDIFVINTSTMALWKTIPGFAQGLSTAGLSISSDGKYLFVANYGDNKTGLGIMNTQTFAITNVSGFAGAFWPAQLLKR